MRAAEPDQFHIKIQKLNSLNLPASLLVSLLAEDIGVDGFRIIVGGVVCVGGPICVGHAEK